MTRSGSRAPLVVKHVGVIVGRDRRGEEEDAGQPDAAGAGLALGTNLGAAVLERAREFGLGAGRHVGAIGPCLPRGEEIAQRRVVAGATAHLAAFLNPLAERIFAGEVLASRCADDLRRREADALPRQASLDGPSEDAAPLGNELLRQV